MTTSTTKAALDTQQKSYLASQQLEQIIDRIGLKNTIELLAIICEEKAEHIVANYAKFKTDWPISARKWSSASKALDKAASKIEV